MRFLQPKGKDVNTKLINQMELILNPNIAKLIKI